MCARRVHVVHLYVCLSCRVSRVCVCSGQKSTLTLGIVCGSDSTINELLMQPKTSLPRTLLTRRNELSDDITIWQVRFETKQQLRDEDDDDDDAREIFSSGSGDPELFDFDPRQVNPQKLLFRNFFSNKNPSMLSIAQIARKSFAISAIGPSIDLAWASIP